MTAKALVFSFDVIIFVSTTCDMASVASNETAGGETAGGETGGGREALGRFRCVTGVSGAFSGVEGGVYSFFGCFSHLTIDPASLSRRSTVSTPNR